MPPKAEKHFWLKMAVALFVGGIPMVITICVGTLSITSRLTALETKVGMMYDAWTKPGDVKPVPIRVPQQKHIATNPF